MNCRSSYNCTYKNCRSSSKDCSYKNCKSSTLTTLARTLDLSLTILLRIIALPMKTARTEGLHTQRLYSLANIRYCKPIATSQSNFTLLPSPQNKFKKTSYKYCKLTSV
ncbi:hypothetical protein OTU49_010064 [Cherax quadricarinatus]|uniref:Uncharacterized protein n=1 Tax=Cherax quadricarinatus TaxID=27406 RepID=A0AAW0W9H4_CHEQU